MRQTLCYHPTGDDTRGSVQRRTARYEQSDPRGQYPRPRDNQFAQPKPRLPVTPQPAEPQVAPQRPEPQPQPQEAVYQAGAAQYEKPKTPYVPGYMRAPRRDGGTQEPQAFSAPVPQLDKNARQNPYVVMSEKNDGPRPAVKRRTLVILTFAAAFALACAWVAQLVFAGQTQAVFAARAAAEASIANKHPYTYRELIEREAVQNNLNPAFVAAIILNESSFNPKAESSIGARGLMQLMEDTAKWVYEQIGVGETYSFDLMYDAETNVRYGCWYLAYLSDKFGGDPVLVAAAFHSGQTNVQNWLDNKAYSADHKTMELANMPDGNTKTYVEKVIKAFAAYRRLYYEEVTA